MPTFHRQSSELFPDDWLKWLGKFVGKPHRALEVGCYEGRSTIWFAENILTHEAADITVVDWFQGNDPAVEAALKRDQRGVFSSNLKPHWKKLARVLGTKSSLALPLLLSQDHSFDWIYVDGSHDACDVLSDSVLCWHLLKPGGVMFWDDYTNDRFPGVRIAIDSFLACHTGQYNSLMNKGYQVAVEKI